MRQLSWEHGSPVGLVGVGADTRSLTVQDVPSSGWIAALLGIGVVAGIAVGTHVTFHSPVRRRHH